MGITLSKSRGNKGFDSNSQYIFSITGKAKKYDREQEIVALRHNILREIFKANFLSPIKNELKSGGMRVLDVGCGFGIWLFEMSSDFPNNYYVGVDLTPQLFTKNKPSNVEFVTANIYDGLPFCDGSFDFVFLRNMVYDLQENKWPVLISECARVVKPGGYFEITEAALDLISSGPLLNQVVTKFFNYLNTKNVNPAIVNRMEEFMKDTNKFKSINHDEKPFVLGSWSNHLNYAFESYTDYAFRSVLKFSVKKEDFDEMLRKLLKEANAYRTRTTMHKFVSQKIEA
ncbi:10873_t:CDS:2 [Scutellospora calospora]|uniref:10873_t:CDS:1 n=1 Tax=Scutellospora calospora TaxID=85575 RepID=A0ACA9LHZ2_9GLOM|nr:10873_t:CDS:2 [Scutellospora calospora]